MNKINAILCLRCLSLIQSMGGESLTTCGCGAVSIGGGPYRRLQIGSPDDYMEVLTEEDFHAVQTHLNKIEAARVLTR